MADVTIVDTSPRDGPVALPKIGTPEKIALAKSLMQSGLTKIDCVAFTHPRIRPEFADAEEVINALILTAKCGKEINPDSFSFFQTGLEYRRKGFEKGFSYTDTHDCPVKRFARSDQGSYFVDIGV